MRTIRVPGATDLSLDHLVLDLNGTLSDRGVLIPGVADRLAALEDTLEVHIVTADTLGTAAALAVELPVSLATVSGGGDKAAFIERLGSDRTAAIGNGRNDEDMLRAAALGVAVIGPEGAATSAILAADVVCTSILDALDLLLVEATLPSTLRP